MNAEKITITDNTLRAKTTNRTVIEIYGFSYYPQISIYDQVKKLIEPIKKDKNLKQDSLPSNFLLNLENALEERSFFNVLYYLKTLLDTIQSDPTFNGYTPQYQDIVNFLKDFDFDIDIEYVSFADIKKYIQSPEFTNFFEIKEIKKFKILAIGSYKTVFYLKIKCADGSSKELVLKLNTFKIFNESFENEFLIKQRNNFRKAFNHAYFMSRIDGHSICVEEYLATEKINVYETFHALGRMFSIMMDNFFVWGFRAKMIDDVHLGNFGFNTKLFLTQCIDIGLTKNVELYDFLVRVMQHESWAFLDDKTFEIFKFFEGFFLELKLSKERIQTTYQLINGLDFFSLMGGDNHFIKPILNFMFQIRIKNFDDPNIQALERINLYRSQMSAA